MPAWTSSGACCWPPGSAARPSARSRPKGPLSTAIWQPTSKSLRDRLGPCRLKWLAGQVEAAAEAVLRGEDPPAGFFVSGQSEQLARRAGGAAGAGHGKARCRRDGAAATRIVWACGRQTRRPGGYRAAGTEARAARLEQAEAAVAGRRSPATRSCRPGTPRWRARCARTAPMPSATASTGRRRSWRWWGTRRVALAEATRSSLVDLVEGTPELEVRARKASAMSCA